MPPALNAAERFTIGSPTVADWSEKAWIFHGFSRKYRHRHHWKHFQWPGSVVRDISNEKYFHQISNSYFEPCFLLNFVENLMLFEPNLMVMYEYRMVPWLSTKNESSRIVIALSDRKRLQNLLRRFKMMHARTCGFNPTLWNALARENHTICQSGNFSRP